MNSISKNLNEHALNNKITFGNSNQSGIVLPNQLLAAQQQPEVQLPDMYYMPEEYKKPETAKDRLKKVDIMGLVTPWFEHPLLMLGTCFGISFGIDAFDKSCNKEYEKSIVGKAGKFGDKIHNSKFIQSEPSQKVLGGIKKGWKSVRDFAMKSSIISAMVKTPSKPELNMPKDELLHTDARIVNKFKELVSEYGIVPEELLGEVEIKPLKLKQMNLNSEEIEYLKKTYEKNSIFKVPETESVNRIKLRRIGKSEAEIAEILQRENPNEIVGNELFKHTGFSVERWKGILQDKTGAKLDDVIEASEKLEGLSLNKGNKLFMIKGSTHQPFASVEGFRGIANRGNSIIVGKGVETKTGRFMSKFLQKIHRGFTFGGAKLGVMIFVAPLLVETMLNTKKADKKEKVGTAVGGVIDSVSWVFTFPLILKAIYAIGGIQNAGMGEDKVAEKERLIKEFNDKARNLENPEHFANWSAYRAGERDLKNQLRELRQVKGQSLFTKLLRGISRFGKADLMKIETYKSGNVAADIARRFPLRVKDFGYSAGRFMVFMMVGMPLIDKLIRKCTSMLFGKSYNAEKETEVKEAKEKEEKYTMEDLRARMIEAQQNKLNPKAESVAENATNSPIEDNGYKAALAKSAQEMFDRVENPETNKSDVNPNAIDEQTAQLTDPISKARTGNADGITDPAINEAPGKTSNNIPQSQTNDKNSALNNRRKRDNYTYIPSSENPLSKSNMINGQIQKYIPSQEGIKINKTFDNSGLEAALRRAARAEQRAINVLAGNFENMG